MLRTLSESQIQSQPNQDALSLHPQTESYQRLPSGQPSRLAQLNQAATSFLNKITSESFLRFAGTLGLLISSGAAGWAATTAANRSSHFVNDMGALTPQMQSLVTQFRQPFNLTKLGADHPSALANLTLTKNVFYPVLEDMLNQAEYLQNQFDAANKSYHIAQNALLGSTDPQASQLDKMSMADLFLAEQKSLDTLQGLAGLAHWLRSFLPSEPVGAQIAGQLSPAAIKENMFCAQNLLGKASNRSSSAPDALTDCAQSPVALGPVLNGTLPYADLPFGGPSASVWIKHRGLISSVFGEELAKLLFDMMCLEDNTDSTDRDFDNAAIREAFMGRYNESTAVLARLGSHFSTETSRFDKTEFQEINHAVFETLGIQANVSIDSVLNAVAKLQALDFKNSQQTQLKVACSVFVAGLVVAVVAKLLEQGLHKASVSAGTPSDHAEQGLPPGGSIELTELAIR